jgi:pyruvate, orthophosphate dikinase
VTSWQMKDEATPNDHADPGYDGAVIGQLLQLHRSFSPLLVEVMVTAPRLTQYGVRFDHAVKQIESGDHSYVARPILDSYHTVWFEFHEDLLGLLGLSRFTEAAAGRA